MKYQENVYQYKNVSSISIVSGSHISHTSSLLLASEENPVALRAPDVPLSKGLKEFLKPRVFPYLLPSAPEFLDCQSSQKASLAFMVETRLSFSGCRGAQGWKLNRT
jgi:hypothetical protein